MPLRIHKRNKIWHYSGTVAGRRLRGSTKTTDKKIAERIAAKVEANAWRMHLDGPGATLTFAQASIAYRQAGRSERFLDKLKTIGKTRWFATSPAKQSGKWRGNSIQTPQILS